MINLLEVLRRILLGTTMRATKQAQLLILDSTLVEKSNGGKTVSYRTFFSYLALDVLVDLLRH